MLERMRDPDSVGAAGTASEGGHDGWPPWAVWVLTLVAASASTTGLVQEPTLTLVQDVGLLVGVLVIATIGALVVSRGHAPLPGWLLLGFAFFWSVGGYAYHLLGLITASDPTSPTAARVLIAVGDVSYVLAIFGLIYLFLVMPDGKLPSQRWTVVGWGHGALIVFWAVQSVLLAGTVTDMDAWLSRTTLGALDGADPGAALTTVTWTAAAVSSAWMLLVPAALVLRYRSSGPETRQQLKWILFAALAVVIWLVSWIPHPTSQIGRAIQSLLPGVALTCLAAAFGLALFKYRLWDVDVVIRRSLVYGILWLTIAAVYAGMAAGLGLFAGARVPVEVAIALTVLATLVFQPARRRLEGLADRLVFGRRGTPAEAVQSLGAAVGRSSGPRDIATALASVTHRVIRVAAVCVEITGAPRSLVGEWGDGDVVAVPVAWGSEAFGTVTCLAHRGERLHVDDVGLVEALATQAALSVAHARLASRMVAAQETERRRIERNIHDGVQQDLATLIGQLALARSRVNGDGELSASLERMQEGVRRTLSEIRDLAQGIHPSVLRDGGLVAAIEDRCSRLPLRVTINAAPGVDATRFSDATETAAYLTVAEAVTNVVKHASASSLTVEISEDEDLLSVRVVDDGVGFDTSSALEGSGLHGLSDRLDALGGELSVRSRPRAGTTVLARLPITAATVSR